MLRIAPFRLNPRAIIALTGAAVLLPAAGAGAVTRYAANYRYLPPVGTGDCTNPAKPCALTAALASADPGDDVSLAPGTYRAPGQPPVISPGKAGPGELSPVTQPPYSNPLVVRPGVTLHGTDPGKLPVIVVAPNSQGEPGVELSKNAKIIDVGINGQAAPNAAITYSLQLGENAIADRVRVRTVATANATQLGVALGFGSTLRNSVSLGTGSATGGRITAVAASSPNQTSTVRNVTAISATPNGEGIASGTADGVNTISISNTIARGTRVDLRLRAGVSGGQATANIGSSNWVTQEVSAVSGATAVLQQTGGNQSGPTAAEPLFFDAAAGDFRQLPGSPTINAGVVDLNNGLLAFGGALRKIGVTTDIGADEFDPANPPLVPQPPEEPETPDPTTPEPTTPAPTTPIGDPPQPSPPGDGTAPVVSGLSIAKKFKRSKGTTIRFTLSEPANVALAFAQPQSGRLVGGKCVKTTRKNRKQAKCPRPNLRGTVIVAGKAGLNTLKFKGALTAKKRLAFGTYALTATPTDSAGNKGAEATKRFALTR